MARPIMNQPCGFSNLDFRVNQDNLAGNLSENACDCSNKRTPKEEALKTG